MALLTTTANGRTASAHSWPPPLPKRRPALTTAVATATQSGARARALGDAQPGAAAAAFDGRARGRASRQRGGRRGGAELALRDGGREFDEGSRRRRTHDAVRPSERCRP